MFSPRRFSSAANSPVFQRTAPRQARTSFEKDRSSSSLTSTAAPLGQAGRQRPQAVQSASTRKLRSSGFGLRLILMADSGQAFSQRLHEMLSTHSSDATRRVLWTDWGTPAKRRMV